ncbi:CBS domain-containing protein [Halomarina halobia]|uniref:CBS domain-containing protein n=1 Tax=Halomarina halobia TaxID=3033386 RepID=A0ABD6A8S3_9EURY|nr:CBS domain-containing protein [Halomarina sp. PSR21]
MDIADIATREFVEVDGQKRLSKVRSIFEHENPKGVIVTDDGDYQGVITQQQLLQSHIEDDMKAAAMVKSAPKIERTADLRNVARMLIEGDTKVAPVFEGDDLWGIITADAILDAVLENLDVLTVDQIFTEDLVTVTEDTHIGRAINLLRENGVSRLPVVNENGRLTGMLTTHDIVDVVVRNMDKPTQGDRAGDIERVLDLPVYDVMANPVTTVDLDDTVREAVELMFEMDYSGLVVTPEYDDSLPAGILTKTDVLRALTYTEEEHMDVQITNIDLLDTITRDEIRRSIEAVVEKYQRMSVQHAHVRFHKHKEKLRGTPLIQCQIRLRTTHGQVAGSGEGYGAESAFRVALDRLERNVIEMKGMESDEQYRGQLLRKLNEL